MYIKKCTICGKEFKTDHRKTKTCSNIKFYAYVSAIRKKKWHCSVCSHSASMCVINSDREKYDSLMSERFTIDIYIPCRWCGNVFLAHSMHRCYCSNECRKAKENHDKSERKSKRYKQARANGKYETISLQRLYIRDKGKCYLCGKHLTLTEDYNRADAPTIEHVIPICKGGTNTWGNVKLACRNCNVEKGIKILGA